MMTDSGVSQSLPEPMESEDLTSGECGVCKKNKSEKAQSSPSKFQRDEEWDIWIQCEICYVWFHASCVGVEEYEVSLIKHFHCDKCASEYGTSKMKEVLCHHRHLFGEDSEVDKPTQIGTRAFVEEFKVKSKMIPNINDESITVCEDGYSFLKTFNYADEWKVPYKVLKMDGLEMKMPESGFNIDSVIDLLGEDIVIETIDVFAQHSNLMSLGRFKKLWNAENRERLYNILSLEFSDTPMAEFVRSPILVRQLSWVCKFWPILNGKTVNDGSERAIFNNALLSYDTQLKHSNMKPFVENFCLLGMQDSYTDFHIDFGGSSVWYHVFRGEKVFYVVAPTDENLSLFADYQLMSNRTEIFFGDLLPPDQLHKLEVKEGETLLIPSGWIHAVWTPVDSLVFGGNFLHSLNIAMQLKVYEMEDAAQIGERFKFPYFELTNWYAVQASILESLKGYLDANEEHSLIPSYLKAGIEKLIPQLRSWFENDKKSVLRRPTLKAFNRTLKELEKEFRRQRQWEEHGSTSPNISDAESDYDDDEKFRILASGTALKRFGQRSPVKLKIRLPKASFKKPKKHKSYTIEKNESKAFDGDYDKMPSTSTTANDNNNDDYGNEKDIDIDNIFATRRNSLHGRRVKPSSKLYESFKELGCSSLDFCNYNNTEEKAPKSKNFMSQFTDEEQRIILKTEKAGEKDRDYLEKFEEKSKKSLKKISTCIKSKSETVFGEGRRAAKRPDTVKQRLAKKLKIKF